LEAKNQGKGSLDGFPDIIAFSLHPKAPDIPAIQKKFD
jgi:hypothetical protein